MYSDMGFATGAPGNGARQNGSTGEVSPTTRVAVVDARPEVRSSWVRALADDSAVEVAVSTWCLDDAVALRQAPDIALVGECAHGKAGCTAQQRLERLGCRVVRLPGDAEGRDWPALSPGQAATAPDTPSAPALSQRERRVLELYTAGMTLAEVAATLYITENTVATYVKRIRAKLRAAGLVVESKMQLRDGAQRCGLLPQRP